VTGETLMNPFFNPRPVVGKASVSINKPITHVFFYVGEKFFDNYPKWTPEVSDFKPLTGKTMHVGAKAQQVRLEQGQNVETVFEISELEPPQKVTLTGVDAPFRNTYLFSGENDINTTNLEFSFEILELELFMRPFEKLIRMAIEEGAENTVINIKNLLVN
jgi:hypothetical protein